MSTLHQNNVKAYVADITMPGRSCIISDVRFGVRVRLAHGVWTCGRCVVLMVEIKRSLGAFQSRSSLLAVHHSVANVSTLICTRTASSPIGVDSNDGWVKGGYLSGSSPALIGLCLALFSPCS